MKDDFAKKEMKLSDVIELFVRKFQEIDERLDKIERALLDS